MAESTTRIAWSNRIQTKLSLILIVLTTLVLAGYALFDFYSTKTRMERELNDLAELTVTRLSKHLFLPLWNLDDDQVEDALASEMTEKRVYAIIVRDKDNRAVLHGKRRDDNSWNVQKTDNANIRPDGLVVATKDIVGSGTDKVGVIHVYLTQKFMQQDLNQLIITIAITTLILNLVIFLAIFTSLNTILIQPVRHLTEVTERMSMGNLDVKIDIHSKDEIGLLAEAIERMEMSLRLAMERLRKGH